MTQLTIVGNLGTEVDLKFTTSGAALAQFLVISSDRVKNPNTQEWEDADRTAWNVKCWRVMAENCADTLVKGSPVILTGKVAEETWEGKEGEKRSKMVLTAFQGGLDLSRRSTNNNSTQNRDGITRSNASAPKQADPWATAGIEAPPF